MSILVLFHLYICDSISTLEITTKRAATYYLRITVRTQRHLSS